MKEKIKSEAKPKNKDMAVSNETSPMTADTPQLDPGEDFPQTGDFEPNLIDSSSESESSSDSSSSSDEPDSKDVEASSK